MIAWGEPAFHFSANGTPASIIKLADVAGRFATDNAEAALAELAGANRTTQTVKANADAIASETQNRQTADSNLQTQVTNHASSSSAHNAANIPIADAGGRYTGTNTEAALQEIAGAGRTTETVKGVADAINNHKSDADGAHAASAISTEAITGSPFSLAASQLQTVLSSLVTALNARALKSGDTFSGAVTFNGGATFDNGGGDYPDGSGLKFDSDIWFFRTISAFAGRGISFSSYSPALDNDSYGGVQFSAYGQNLIIPIPLYGSSKLSRVRFYFQIPPNTTGRATLHLKVTSTPSFYAGTATFQPTIVAEATAFQSESPANDDATHWTTLMHQLDCGDLEIGGSDYTKMVFATVIMTEAAGKALVCPGVKVAYKRTKVAV